MEGSGIWLASRSAILFGAVAIIVHGGVAGSLVQYRQLEAVGFHRSDQLVLDLLLDGF
jgi:hypothetical protein